MGLFIDGPIGADLALPEPKHDAYIAMYHDQGHIAIKMLSPRGSSSFTLGAPVLLGSVGHGAAFDIAGRGIADASAMENTITLLAKSAL